MSETLFYRMLMSMNCSILLLVPFITYTRQANGETIIIQQDTLQDGDQGAVQTGFEQNDIAACVFTLPEGIDAFIIERVQVMWGVDPAHVGFHTICDLTLYCGGLPDPGSPISTIEGVALQPTFMNELDVSSDGWVVLGDSPFAVGYRYSWAIGEIDTSSSHIVTDTTGCHTGRNMVYNSRTASWVDPCLYGLPGNFVIRLVGEAVLSKAPFGDSDNDGDIDQSDFGAFQRCFRTPNPEECLEFDCNRDEIIDLDDLAHFEECASGPDVLADMNCGSCLPVGICPLALRSILALARQQTDSRDEPELVWWVWVLIGIGVIAVILAARSFFSKMHVQASLNAWKASYRCPLQGTQDSDRLKQGMIYLRDTLGQSDPEAQAMGSYLMNNHMYMCDAVNPFVAIATGPNPKNFYGHVPIGTDAVPMYIDKQFVEWRYSPEMLALLLYAESCHFLNQAGVPEVCLNEGTCQLRLDAFRQRHNMKNLLGDMIHGLKEGYVEKLMD